MEIRVMRQSRANNSKLLGSLLIMVAWLAISTASAYAQNTVTKVTLIMTDAQGNVLMTKDVHGNVLTRYTYRPYGAQQSGPTNAGPGYTGHVHDPDTGLVYMQQRYYNPLIGRFISPDPVMPKPGNIFNFGRYTYGNGNPYKYTDPHGESVLEFLAGLEYETYSAITGHGFHGHRLVGALVDGYNGEGPGVAGAAMQDAGIVLTVATLGAAGPEVGAAEAGGEAVGEGAAAISADAAGDLASALKGPAGKLSSQVAKTFRATSTTARNGAGETYKLANGKVIVRVMEKGGGRTNYMRVSIKGKGSVDGAGNLSSDLSKTHIPINGDSLQFIKDVINRYKE